jgi:dihydroorotate dehydrogenase
LIEVNNTKVKPKPILLKIAPDLSFEQLDDIIEIVTDTKAYGIIATNTTIDREGLSYKKEYIEAIGSGGLSGVPLRKKSTEIIRYITQKSMNRIPVIGSGGIMNPEDATEKIEAGASLIQIYTGFIYEGPSIIKNICKEISKKK